MLVFYDDRQQVESNESVSPSAGKPKLVLESWKKLGFPIDIKKVTPLTVDEICLAHDPDYVNGVINCELLNGFDNKNKEVAASLTWTTGSFASAAIYAYKNKQCTFSPTSGFHHAHYSSPMGFCTFSGLTIAAIILNKFHGAKKIGIIDLDSHVGNGTLNTIAKTNSQDFIIQYSIGYYNINPMNNEQWLHDLPSLISDNFSDCDIIFYQAGMDSHIDDPFVTSGFFTDSQIYQRDKIVYQTCNKFNIPVVTNLAGGYQTPVEKVIALHDMTVMAYHEVYK